MNEIIQSLYRRKSVRAFEDRPVAEDLRRAVLDAAVQAPTAGGQQLYTILDIRKQEIKDTLAETCDHQPFIATAPIVLVFCADCRRWQRAYELAGAAPRDPGVGDLLLAVSDTLIAAQNAVVAAESLGLGSCYIGDIMEQDEAHRKLLALPRWVFPAAMLVMGWPTQQQIERPKHVRFDQRHIVHTDAYRTQDEAELREMFSGHTGGQDFEGFLSAFCKRKYNAAFSLEMGRSVAAYLADFSSEA